MMRLAIALAVLITAPAYGQGKLDHVASVRITDALAVCVINQQQDRVIEALAKPRDYKRDTDVMRNFINEGCLPVGAMVSVDPMLFRGYLARTIVRKNYKAPPSKLGGQPVIEDDTWASILNFADCVIRDKPRDVHSLLIAPSGSSEERSAFGALHSSINKCKPWAKIVWNDDWVTSFLSEVYLRKASWPGSVGSK